MNALVVGYGSIGARHTRILAEMGCRVGVVSSREIDYPLSYQELSLALKVEQPGYVVIANKTADHFATFAELKKLKYDGKILIEKPLFDWARLILSEECEEIYVAYNLRFHPAIQRLKIILEQEDVISAHVYVGQYLPNWRPGTDYQVSYSASKISGGGVLRDLSHELDYVNWILGSWQKLSAIGGKFSELDIDSDDIFSLMLTTKKCPVVTIHLNYLDRCTRREIIINTNKHTYKADLIENTITIDLMTEQIQVSRDNTYRKQHEAVLKGDKEYLCRIDEGQQVLKLIEAAEKSSNLRMWIDNE